MKLRDLPRAGPPADIRELQANERTFLAWVRTGLAAMAFGFVLARMGPSLSSPGSPDRMLVWIGMVLVAGGVMLNVVAAYRHGRTRAALMAGETVATGALAPVLLAVGVTFVGVLLLVYIRPN